MFACCNFNCRAGVLWTVLHYYITGPVLEGFGHYPVFTALFTGKYRPGKKQVWDTQSGKNREKHSLGLFFMQFTTSIKDLIGPWKIYTQELIIIIYIQMVISNAFICLIFFWFIYKLILPFWQHTQHKYIFSLIWNVNIQTAQATACIFNWWMDVLEKQYNLMCQKIYGSNGVWGLGDTWTSNLQMLYHLKFELSRPAAVYLMFFILTVVKKINRVFICGVNIKYDICALAMAFYFWMMMNGWSWEIVYFFTKKIISLQGVSEP